MLVEHPIEIDPFATNLHIRLIDTPARRSRTTPLPAQTLFDLWGILLNPPIDRGMIDRDAAFSHHLIQIPVADPIAAIPTHRPKDDLAFKMTPLEL